LYPISNKKSVSEETIPVENYALYGEQKYIFHIFLYGGAQHFCSLKSHPILYFEPLKIS